MRPPDMPRLATLWSSGQTRSVGKAVTSISPRDSRSARIALAGDVLNGGGSRVITEYASISAWAGTISLFSAASCSTARAADSWRGCSTLRAATMTFVSIATINSVLQDLTEDLGHLLVAELID